MTTYTDQNLVDITCISCRRTKERDPELQTTMGWTHHHGIYLCPQCTGPRVQRGHVITAKEIDFLRGVVAQYGPEAAGFSSEQVSNLRENQPLTALDVKMLGEGLALSARGNELLAEVLRLGNMQDALYQGMAYPCPVCHRAGNYSCVGCDQADAFGLNAFQSIPEEERLAAKGKPIVTKTCAARTRVRLIEEATSYKFEQRDAISGKPIYNFTPSSTGEHRYDHLRGMSTKFAGISAAGVAANGLVT